MPYIVKPFPRSLPSSGIRFRKPDLCSNSWFSIAFQQNRLHWRDLSVLHDHIPVNDSPKRANKLINKTFLRAVWRVLNVISLDGVHTHCVICLTYPMSGLLSRMYGTIRSLLITLHRIGIKRCLILIASLPTAVLSPCPWNYQVICQQFVIHNIRYAQLFYLCLASSESSFNNLSIGFIL